MDPLTHSFLATALTLTPLMAMEQPEDQQTTGWSKLSSELKVEIASYLLPSSVASASLVHSDWYAHVDHDMAWKQRVRNDFPSYQGQKVQEKSWKDIYISKSVTKSWNG